MHTVTSSDATYSPDLRRNNMLYHARRPAAETFRGHKTYLAPALPLRRGPGGRGRRDRPVRRSAFTMNSSAPQGRPVRTRSRSKSTSSELSGLSGSSGSWRNRPRQSSTRPSRSRSLTNGSPLRRPNPALGHVVRISRHDHSRNSSQARILPPPRPPCHEISPMSPPSPEPSPQPSARRNISAICFGLRRFFIKNLFPA